MKQDKMTPFEQWRWKINRKVAEFIHEPDDLNQAELEAMIDSYRNYHRMKMFINIKNY